MKLSLERICCEQDSTYVSPLENSLDYIRLHKPPAHPDDTVHLSLISQYLSLSIATLPSICFSSRVGNADTQRGQTLSEALAVDTLLQWSPILREHMPEKQYNNLLLRAYSAVVQASTSQPQAHSEEVLSLRLYGFLCLSRTVGDAVEPDTFWSHASKFFASSMQKLVPRDGTATHPLLTAFDQIQEAISRRVDAAKFFASPAFVKFTECRLEYATKVRPTLSYILLEGVLT